MREIRVSGPLAREMAMRQEFYNKCHDKGGLFCEDQPGGGAKSDGKGSLKGRFEGHDPYAHVVTEQDALDAIQPEGRDALEYIFNARRAIEPDYTNELDQIASNHGGYLGGIDHYLKSPKSIVSRINRNMNDGKTAEEAVSKLGDSLRYSVVLPEDSYADGVKDTVLSLDDKGYKFKEIGNSWARGGQYAGMNTSVEDPHTGLSVEIQFHTPDSFRVKNELHNQYETMRELNGSRDELYQTWSQMTSASDAVSRPKGYEDISGNIDTGLTNSSGGPLIMEYKLWNWEKTSKKLDKEGR